MSENKQQMDKADANILKNNEELDADFQESFERVFGLSLDALDREWWSLPE